MDRTLASYKRLHKRMLDARISNPRRAISVTPTDAKGPNAARAMMGAVQTREHPPAAVRAVESVAPSSTSSGLGFG